MTSLVSRLRDADERVTLLSVLREITLVISTETLPDIPSLLCAVLENQPKIAKFLTSTEASSIYDEIFRIAPPLFSIVALSNSLQYAHVSSDTVTRLVTVMDARLAEVLRDSLSCPITDEIKLQYFCDLVCSLVSINDRIANAASRILTGSGVRAGWRQQVEISILNSMTSCIESAVNMVSHGKDTNLRVMSMFLSKGRNLEVQYSTLLTRLVHWLSDLPADPILDRVSQRLFTDEDYGVREFESIVSSVVLAVRNAKDLERLLGLSIRSSAATRRVCCERLLLQQVGSAPLPSVLADYIASAGGKDIYLNTFKSLLLVWSDVCGIRFSPLEQQKYITICVLEFARRFDDLGLSAEWEGLFALIVQGVQERLGNADLSIRQSGMFVGETLSSYMKSSAEPLRFDYKEDNWMTQMRRIVNPLSTSSSSEVTVSLAPPPLPEAPPPVSESMVIDRLAKTSIPLDSDDEEDDFPQYEVPEEERNPEKVKEGEEPETVCAAPFYLRDAMDRLNEKEKYQVFESGLFALEQLIRRRALEFDQLAGSLAQRLLFLTDKFSTENFETYRKSCLVACLVTRPELAPQLADTLFSRSCAVFHRYIILDCLLSASRELSSPPISNDDVIRPSTKERIIEKRGEEDSSDWRAVVDARIRANTRLIGTKKTPTCAGKTGVNRFASVATMFFYPLLRTTTEEHLQLRGRDSVFLSRILFTAGEILQLASSSPSVLKMAHALSSLVADLRFHSEPCIRAAVLFSYYSIAMTLSPKLLHSEFLTSACDWLEWSSSLHEDSAQSEQDRTMAGHVGSVILEKLKEAEEEQKMEYGR